MNRRQFLTLPLIACTTIPLTEQLCRQPCAQTNQSDTPQHPVWLRGTYTGWPKPGVPL